MFGSASNNGVSALALVDFYPVSRGGHFKVWLQRVFSIAVKEFDFVGVYVSGIASVPTEEILSAWSREVRRADVVFFDLDTLFCTKPATVMESASRLGHIVRHLSLYCGTSQLSAFVMWAPDLLENEALVQVPWAGIGCLSSVLRDLKNETYDKELAMLRKVNDDKNLEALLLWDPYIVASAKNDKLIYLADAENVSQISGLCERPVVDSRRIVAGCVGQLWGYRTVDFTLDLLRSNSDIEGFLAGELKWDGYTQETSEILKNPEKIRLRIVEGFVPSDAELNGYVSQIDALVLDSRRYPNPSGIALRALALGKCLLISGGESWAASLISDYGCGIVVSPDDSNVGLRIVDWYASGGSERARDAAKKFVSEDEANAAIELALRRLDMRSRAR